MIRVLVVDDQSLVRAGFRTILDSEPGIEVVGEASDGAEAIARVAELAPDVVCMDVQMPGMDGLEASRRIVADPSNAAAILVLTTFDREDYLFEALQAGASGFLLKNASPERLIDAVQVLAGGDALLAPDATRRVIEAARTPAAGAASTAPTPAAAPAPVAPAPLAPTPTPTPTEPLRQNVGLRATSTGAEGRQVAQSAGVAGGNEPGDTSNAGRAATTATTATATTATDAALGTLTEREREVLVLLAEGLSNSEIAARIWVGDATVKTHVSKVLAKLGLRDRVHAVVYAYEHGVVSPSA